MDIQTSKEICIRMSNATDFVIGCENDKWVAVDDVKREIESILKEYKNAPIGAYSYEAGYCDALIELKKKLD